MTKSRAPVKGLTVLTICSLYRLTLDFSHNRSQRRKKLLEGGPLCNQLVNKERRVTALSDAASGI
jgi:hypothetical protein